MQDSERIFLDAAFAMAQEAINNNEVPVGCVFVYKSEIIARGRNDVNRSKNPTNHAEMCALKQLEQWCLQTNQHIKEILKETTLYVTIEPCIMCACALYYLKLKRIVYGAANERFGGLGSVANREMYSSKHLIQIDANVDKERAVKMLKDFYDQQNPFCPLEKRKVKKPKNDARTNEQIDLFSLFDV
uniref:CMP/dCMP-type deaminase domain-containing protein n=1 Tax=Ascaris lumbricoides TaxID=6252 RepID=A0A0M3I680_ASCLU